jgi:hypothetical protein
VAQPRRQTLVLVLGFCLAIAATFFFGYRAGRTARHVRSQNEPIRAWMSVPFIAHTHHMPEEVLFRAIRVLPNPRDHRPIRDIARIEQVPVTQLIHDLQTAVERAASGVGAPNAKAP